MGKSASAFCLTELCSRALTGVVTSSSKCFVVFIINFLHFHQVDVAVNSIMEWSTFWSNFYVFRLLHERAFGFLVFLKLVILLSALPYLPVEQAEQVFKAAVCHSRQANNSCVVDPIITPDGNFCFMIPMSHHVSTLSSACGSRILALHAMFQRSRGGQRGVAEENGGKSL